MFLYEFIAPRGALFAVPQRWTLKIRLAIVLAPLIEALKGKIDLGVLEIIVFQTYVSKDLQSPGGLIRRLGSFFLVQNFEFHYFWGFQKKTNIKGGIEDFVDIFGGSSQYCTIFRGHLYRFRVFS